MTTGGSGMELKTEILIIGGGASGMAAAVAAAEMGAEVTVAEANAAVGGNGLFPRGIFGVDSKIQRKKLVFADRDQIFRDCMNYSHWKIDGRIIRTLIDKSGDTVNWLMDRGVEFCDVVHHIPNQTPEVFHITEAEENVGHCVIRNLKRICEEKGVRILTGAKGKTLLKDEKASVCGAVCETKDGEVVIKAQKVILCTGGFAGNDEMVEKYYPGFKRELVGQGGGMRHPGDGIRMALEAGAEVEGNFTMEAAAPKIKGYDALNLFLGKPYNVWLNRFGERFADEGIVYNFAVSFNACLRQPDGQVWVVFNQALLDQTLSDGKDMIETIHMPPNVEERLDTTMEQAIADGVLCKADSYEALAAFIGCDEETVKASMEEYNAFCHAGRDGWFAKDKRYMLSMEEGPYYAIKAGEDMLITHGGIRVNERFEALGGDYKPVENLYVAGVDFGGADADVYNVVMSGHGFGFAVNSGRIAGENAVKALK